MSKFGVLVMGPAGAGKTTFCASLIQHLRLNRRSCFYVNLDPAAEDFSYEPDLDIKDLISLEDVMEEMNLGPNGGLIYCFEFLLENLDFLTQALDPITEESLIIIDMPGQIELYTHVPVLPSLVRHLTRLGALNINLCAAYLLESTFVVDRAKFFAGTLSAMSAMILLEVPHVNVLSKMDLVKDTMSARQLRRFLDPDRSLLDTEHLHHDPYEEGEDEDADADVDADKDETPPAADGTNATKNHDDNDHTDPNTPRNVMRGRSFARLNRAVARLIDDFSMVSFLQLDARDEDSLSAVLSYIDHAIQYHEAQEPREPPDDEMDMEMEMEMAEEGEEN
ncbi:MAG: ATP binding protein [Phylliscum demangeonii]|nr:MAG: ATP binding protein [Phylliscum demangeonii]